MILLRLTHGITDHFPVRKTEWLGAYVAVGMVLCLFNQPGMFEMSPSFSKLRQIADEHWWAVYLFLVVVMRLVSLIVNGTFRQFPHSPLLRLLASLGGVFFWSQFCLGFASAAIYSGGVWSPVAAYSTIVLLELLNARQSFEDMLDGYAKKRACNDAGMAATDNT